MPRSRRKGKKSDSLVLEFGDLTINDFANSKEKRWSCRKRIDKKSLVQSSNKEDTYSDLLWYEKEEYMSDEEELISSGNSRNRRRRKNRSLACTADDIDGTYMNYPIDVWFLISEYIYPEDVGKFACICQATRYIVTTARFWFQLYRRYQKWSPELPEELYWNMDELKGLRASVVRSLFYMYAPFASRISNERPLSADPCRLNKSQCILQWHTKGRNCHKYFFKFLDACAVSKNNARSQHKFRLPDVVQSDSLVHFNLEDGCYILEVVCSDICDVQMMMGDFLFHASLGLSDNLTQHKLRMMLGPQHLLSSASNLIKSRNVTLYPLKQVILDPVLSMHIYPWWHPQYSKCLTSPVCSDCNL